MGHTVPDSLIYLFLNLVSHDADAFSSAFPNIDIFITLKGKSIICFVLLEKKNVWHRFYKVTVTNFL